MTCLRSKALRLTVKPTDISSKRADSITHSVLLAHSGVIAHQPVKAGALSPLGFCLFVCGRAWHELQVSLSVSEMVIILWLSVWKLPRTLAHE